MSASILNDYLNAKAAFETRAEKLFHHCWPRDKRTWFVSDVELRPDGRVTITCKRWEGQSDWWYEVTCAPILFECGDDELADAIVKHPPDRNLT